MDDERVVSTAAGPELSLQRRFAPASRCFGCGPANASGLHLETRPDGDGGVRGEWHGGPEHEAFAGFLNGGVCGTLLDCAMNWAAVLRLMLDDELREAPACVTSELSVRFVRPTPRAPGVVVRARAIERHASRVVVEGAIEADGEETATGRGVFVRVARGHPAFGRWRAATRT